MEGQEAHWIWLKVSEIQMTPARDLGAFIDIYVVFDTTEEAQVVWPLFANGSVEFSLPGDFRISGHLLRIPATVHYALGQGRSAWSLKVFI